MSDGVEVRTDALADLVARRANERRREHGPFASPHEAYGVLAEEVAEFFDEVRRPTRLQLRLRMRDEALDIAVAALRFAAEIHD